MTISREQSHQYKVEKITLYQKYLIKPNHITTTVHDNRSIRAKEPLRTRSDSENNKTTDPKKWYYETSRLTVTAVDQHIPATTTQSEHTDEPEDNNSPRQGTETGYFEKSHFTGKYTEEKQEQTTTKKHSSEKGIYLRSMSMAIPTVHDTGECTACHIPCGIKMLSPGSSLYVFHSLDSVSKGQYAVHLCPAYGLGDR